MPDPVYAALYTRDVPDAPSLAAQSLQLEQAAQNAGWFVAERGDDPPRPIGPTRDRRPTFDDFVRTVRAGTVAVLAVADVAVAARSVPDLVKTLSGFRSSGGRLYVVAGGIDTGVAGGELAAIEALTARLSQSKGRSVAAAMGRAKEAGKRIGAPRVSAEVEERVRQLRRDGMGIGRVARIVGIGVSTVQRIEAEDREQGG